MSECAVHNGWCTAHWRNAGLCQAAKGIPFEMRREEGSFTYGFADYVETHIRQAVKEEEELNMDANESNALPESAITLDCGTLVFVLGTPAEVSAKLHDHGGDISYRLVELTTRKGDVVYVNGSGVNLVRKA